MADVVSPSKRSEMMAGIRGKDTSPELFIRKTLHALGYRYRLHDKRLPGKPDLVFPARKSIIEIQGCFWHGHDCRLFKWPSTRSEQWKVKIEGNKIRDTQNQQTLISSGWRILLIWECAMRGRNKMPSTSLVDKVTDGLKADPLEFTN